VITLVRTVNEFSPINLFYLQNNFRRTILNILSLKNWFCRQGIINFLEQQNAWHVGRDVLLDVNSINIHCVIVLAACVRCADIG